MLDDNAMTLSGGQKQRIALARALLGAPRVVVLDEPNANLDSEGEAALTDCVLALKQRKCTVVMITHRDRAGADFRLRGDDERGTDDRRAARGRVHGATCAGRGGRRRGVSGRLVHLSRLAGEVETRSVEGEGA